MEDWLEDKFCKDCDQLVSVPFDKEFINGIDVCNDCAQSKMEQKEL